MRHYRWSEISRNGEACHVAYVTQGNREGWVRHSQDFAEIFRVDAGRASHWTGGAEYELTAGRIVFMRAKDVHGFRVEAASEGFAIHNVAFPQRSLEALMRRYGISSHPLIHYSASGPPSLVLPQAEDRIAASLFREVLHAPRDEFTRDWFLLSLLRLGVSVNRYAELEGAPSWLRSAWLEFEREEGRASRGASDLARIAGCSVSHLGRMFRLHLGTTPTAWILRDRVRRAERLLVGTGYSVADVALLAGFDNLSNFHRRSLLTHGETPLAFRRRHQRTIT